MRFIKALLLSVLLICPVSGWAFPTTGILDNANRADENPVTGIWSASPIVSGLANIKIVSNAFRNAVNVANSGSAFTTATYGPGTEAYFTYTTLPAAAATDTFIWLNGNAENTGGVDGYFCYISKAAGVWTWSINKVTDGSISQLGANLSTQTIANGDGFGCSHEAGVLTAWWKNGGSAWASMGTRSDSTYTTGHIGFSIGFETNTDGVADNFGGGMITAITCGRRALMGVGC